MRSAVWLGLAVSWATGAAAAPAGMPALDANDRAELAKGEVLVLKMKPTNDEGVAARAIGVVKAPPAKVWPVVRDCQHFHEFMPRTKNSRLVKKNGGVMDCEVEIAMPFPLSNLKATTRAQNMQRPDGTYYRSWKLLKGSYTRNDGSWHVIPWDEGQSSLLVYVIDANPDMFIPDAILRSAQTGSLPDVFEAIRKRVRAL